MTHQDTTDWYPSYIDPVRVGYYQRNYGDPMGMDKQPDYWDGVRWIVCDQKGRAFRSRTGFDAYTPPRPWRGLLGPPHE